MFGAGGGTSSYEEIESTDLIVLWGSNARAAHPIFFHHLLKGVRGGASLYVVDPRRSESARFADLWLGIDVGSDIALANAVGKVIIDEGLQDEEFIDAATTDFDLYAEAVQPFSLERAEEITGVPGRAIRDLAVAYATAPTAQLCWTLGITEHANATDNVLALINLALLTGHVGRYGSGLVPVRGQNNVQGGGDMGALPNKLPGFQDVADAAVRARFEAVWGASIPPVPGRHLSQMFEAMEAGELRALHVIGENPAQSEADGKRVRALLDGLEFLVCQDLYLTATAEYADVVLPAAADWCETEGTVTSSERRVQLIRKALEPPAGARADREILLDLARRMGVDWGSPDAESTWDELRSLSQMHGGMSYSRLAAADGIQWPCPDESHPGTLFLHGRLWERPVGGERARFTPVDWVPPVDTLSAEYPLRMTTGRHLDGYNTGSQSSRFSSPNRLGGTLDISPEDARSLGVGTGDTVVVTSRRGAIRAPVRVDEGLRQGLVFMPIHYRETDVNALTNDAWDPRSGTAEFKATAVRVEADA